MYVKDTTMGENDKTPMPPKTCLITLMFGIDDDAVAFAIKTKIDELISNVKDKRYTFQINET